MLYATTSKIDIIKLLQEQVEWKKLIAQLKKRFKFEENAHDRFKKKNKILDPHKQSTNSS